VAALERTFFHDIKNMLAMLVGSSELQVEENSPELAESINQASLRLNNEIAIQQCLLESEESCYKAHNIMVYTGQVIDDIESFFANHPLTQRKSIEFSVRNLDIEFCADIALLSRILCNMLLNALESSKENCTVKLWTEVAKGQVSFCVWNAGEIPANVAKRIFQRNFSTKNESGRGIGTYSMKLFGERIMGGKVSFETSALSGTVFKLVLPLKN
jgi:signal transduction histidine kinase